MLIGSKKPIHLSLNLGKPPVLDVIILKGIAVRFQLKTLSEETSEHHPIEQTLREVSHSGTQWRGEIPTEEGLKKGSRKLFRKSGTSSEKTYSYADYTPQRETTSTGRRSTGTAPGYINHSKIWMTRYSTNSNNSIWGTTRNGKRRDVWGMRGPKSHRCTHRKDYTTTEVKQRPSLIMVMREEKLNKQGDEEDIHQEEGHGHTPRGESSGRITDFWTIQANQWSPR